MLASLLVLSLASFVSNAKITCNSVVINDQSYGYPEHVCINHGAKKNVSRSYVCDGQGGAIVNIFNNTDCSDTPQRTEDPCFDDDNPNTCTYTAHCGGDLCTYVAIEEWTNVTSCWQGRPTAFDDYTTMAMVLDDGCVNNTDGSGSNRWECSGTSYGLLYSYTSPYTGCIETGLTKQTVYQSECNLYSFFAKALDCNAVAPTGAPTTATPTEAPTTPHPTAEPTRGPTQSTLSPSDAPTSVRPGPTTNPTEEATDNPIANLSPTGTPTTPHPTAEPTRGPTQSTLSPSDAPTSVRPGPTTNPTEEATDNPIANLSPTGTPTIEANIIGILLCIYFI
eukprot:667154_1